MMGRSGRVGGEGDWDGGAAAESGAKRTDRRKRPSKASRCDHNTTKRKGMRLKRQEIQRERSTTRGREEGRRVKPSRSGAESREKEQGVSQFY